MREQTSILDGVTEHDVVAVFNPLSTPFEGRVARSVVAPARRNMATTGSASADSFMRGMYGAIDKSHSSMAHVQQKITFQPGQTIRMPGDVAIVIVRQITKELMQRLGKRRQMSDPTAYMEHEKMVVQGQQSMLTDISVETIEEKLQRQLDEMNKTTDKGVSIEEDEEEFPDVSGTDPGNTEGTGAYAPRRPGRPKRAELAES